MLVKIIFFILSIHNFSNASEVLYKQWSKTIATCPSSAKALSSKLESFNTTQSNKLNSYKIDDFNSIFTKKPKETEVIKILFPYMIPDQVTLAGIDKACWPYLSDFYKELKNKKIKQANSQIKAWEGCLVFNYHKTPKVAQQLIQCFKKIK